MRVPVPKSVPLVGPPADGPSATASAAAQQTCDPGQAPGHRAPGPIAVAVAPGRS